MRNDERGNAPLDVEYYGGLFTQMISSSATKWLPCWCCRNETHSPRKWRSPHWTLLLVTLLSFFCLFLSFSSCFFANITNYSFDEVHTRHTGFFPLLHWVSSFATQSSSYSFSPYLQPPVTMEYHSREPIHSLGWWNRSMRLQEHSMFERIHKSTIHAYPAISIRGSSTAGGSFFGRRKEPQKGSVEEDGKRREMLRHKGVTPHERDRAHQQDTASLLHSVDEARRFFSFYSFPVKFSSFRSFLSFHYFSSFLPWGTRSHRSPTSAWSSSRSSSSSSTSASSAADDSIPLYRRKDDPTPSKALSKSLLPSTSTSPVKTLPSASALTLREVCHREILLYCHPQENMVRCLLDVYNEQVRQKEEEKQKNVPKDALSSLTSSPRRRWMEPKQDGLFSSSDAADRDANAVLVSFMPSVQEEERQAWMKGGSAKAEEEEAGSQGCEEENADQEEETHPFSPHCEDWLIARESCMQALQEHMWYQGSHPHSPLPNHSGDGPSSSHQGNRYKEAGFSCSLSEPARDCLRRAPLRLLPQSCRDSTYYRAVVQGGVLKS